MKRIILFTLLSVCLPVILLSQYNPGSYYDMSSVPRQVIFRDDMDDNRNSYLMGDVNFPTRFEYGYMYYQSTGGSSGAKWVSTYIDQTKDFQIEMMLRYVSGEDNNFIGLAFGSVSNGDKHRFGIAADGHYTIDKRVGNDWVDLVAWTKSPLVKRYEWNKLTVRKVGQTYYYFLNETLVFQRPFEAFFGTQLGMYVNSNSTINIDYLEVIQYNLASTSNTSIEYVFREDYSDNSNDWATGNSSERDFSIYSGYYYLDHKREEGYWYTAYRYLYLNSNEDFTIEFSTTHLGGVDSYGYGIFWGSDSELKNRFQFNITANGFYRFSKMENDNYTDIIDWTEHSAVKEGNYVTNVVKIVKTGSQYEFFINDIRVNSSAFTAFSNTWIGFLIYRKQSIKVDYLYVYKSKSTYQPVTQTYSQPYVPPVTQVPSVVSYPKPQVAWIMPNQDNTTVTTQEFLFRYKIVSTSPITETVLFLNGFPNTTNLHSSATKIGDEYYGEKSLTLNPGTNQISLRAKNSGGDDTKTVSIIFQQGTGKIVAQQPTMMMPSVKADVDQNIPSNPKVGYRFALIIGNEDYASYQKTIGIEANVGFAVNDAAVFKEYCQKTLGVEDRNIFYVTNATAGVMNQNIDLIAKIASKLSGTAELIFYYAGHGLPDEITHEPYLIPVDVNAANLATAVKLNDIYQKFSNCGAKRITVFLDACFSGGGRESGLLSARSVKVKPKEDVAQGNLIVFSASTGDQSSLPYKEMGHGMFTYWLLKKLQTSQGKTTYGDLMKYLKENVSVESLRTNYKEQDPQVNVSPSLQSTWMSFTFVGK